MKNYFSNDTLAAADLSPENLENVNERTLLVTRWNWDYEKARAFQKLALKLVQETPHLRVLIACNHPEVFTHGRGLQKPKKGDRLELVDFNPEVNLPFPLHQIERGGGLTFHHPGQFIFYPIVKLNPASLSLSLMMNQIFDFSIEVLKDWGVKDLAHETRLLGLWYGKKKLASMGIAIEKLTTYHGMALNLKSNHHMQKALRNLNPCGLDPEVYGAVDEIVPLPEDYLDNFRTEFMKRVQYEWQ